MINRSSRLFMSRGLANPTWSKGNFLGGHFLENPLKSLTRCKPGDPMGTVARLLKEFCFLGLRWVQARNYFITGLGCGLLWAEWYGCLESAFAARGVPDGVGKTAASMALDQFFWSPLFFGLYIIPLVRAGA